MSTYNSTLEYQRIQLLEKLGQVAETMRQCADVAEEFARTMSGKTIVPGTNPFGDVASLQTGKRKAQALDGDEGQEGKKKKVQRKPKDPNAPKRPPSSYLLFQNEVRAELKAKYPELPNSELLQMIAKRWAAMSEEDKEVYSKKNATAKEAYAAKKAIYDTANVAATAVSPPTAAVTSASKKTAKSPPKAAVAAKATATPVPAPAEVSSSSSESSEDSASDSEESSEQRSDDDDDEEEEEVQAPPPKRVKKVASVAVKPKEKKQKA